MFRCVVSGLLDRVNSFLGGVLYPEDSHDELAELRDEVVLLTREVDTLRAALAQAMNREQEVRRTLTQRNKDLRATVEERDRDRQQLIDLRDVLDLRTNDDLERWFGSEK